MENACQVAVFGARRISALEWVGGWSSFSKASEILVENWQFDKLKMFGNLAKKEFGVRSVL